MCGPAPGRTLPPRGSCAWPEVLKVSVGQHSDKGCKDANQDFYGFTVPREPLLGSKGIAVALADGVSSSEVSRVASEFAVMGLLEDYYCTSEAWSVKKSAERVLAATNSWLHSRTRQSPWRYDLDRGYVCTLSALILKSRTAHILHVGDARIYQLRGGALEQLTQDHRVHVSQEKSYLSRAMGFNAQVEIDYLALPVDQGDLFVLATDGVYEHVPPAWVAATIRRLRGDLDAAARAIVAEALARGSPDNLTVQVVALDELPREEAPHPVAQALPPPPLLQPRATLDGWTIVRELHASARSHIYLAVDSATGTQGVIKAPAIDLQSDPAALERFATEEWVARRVDSAHVLKPVQPARARTWLYLVTEFVDGMTLAQWMADNPACDVETVRGIVQQIARGLQAFHRLEMLHQDLRPENIMIDRNGTVKIIDFGSVRVAGLLDSAERPGHSAILGTPQYAAPEYFLGEPGTVQSDLFSLAVITYQMLSGRLPYGAEVAKARTRAAQRRLTYAPVLSDDREIPGWIDDALRKAAHPDPLQRHEALSEFIHDLRHPNAQLARRTPPLLERHPVLFWKMLSGLLGLALVLVLFARFGR
jgi:serine/threonine protein phosphatase PrpC